MRKLAGSREVRTLVLLLIVFAAAAMKEPRMLEAQALNSILLGLPILLVMAIGQMFVIVSRGIDVSVGSTLGLSAMVVGMVWMRWNPHMPLLHGFVLAVAVGLVLGAVNGALIAGLRIPPIIATLGTMSAYRGLTFVVSGGNQIDSNHIPEALTHWSLDGPLHFGKVTVPWILAMALLLAAMAHIVSRHTRTGRDVFAIGNHPEAARMRGVPVRRTTFLIYAAAGSLAGFAGVLYASRYGFVNPGTAGYGMELTVIAATVIGGCDVRGGSGSIVGAGLGCLLLATLNVALAVLGIAADWQLLAYGAVILVALGLDAVMGRRVATA